MRHNNNDLGLVANNDDYGDDDGAMLRSDNVAPLEFEGRPNTFIPSQGFGDGGMNYDNEVS